MKYRQVLKIFIISWLGQSLSFHKNHHGPQAHRVVLEEVWFNKCLTSQLVPVTICFWHFSPSQDDSYSPIINMFPVLSIFPPFSVLPIQTKIATHHPFYFHRSDPICTPRLVSIPSHCMGPKTVETSRTICHIWLDCKMAGGSDSDMKRQKSFSWEHLQWDINIWLENRTQLLSWMKPIFQQT